jgi:Protein of unknown function (DUF2971)
MPEDISLAAGEVPAAPADDELVYHYTGISGLLGIIEKKVIWATDAWYKNDALEATYALDLIEEYLNGRQEVPSPGQLTARVAWQQIQHISNDPTSMSRSYIVCFSKKADQLGQWRAYGRPRGFSIGFRRRALLDLAGEVHTNADANLREVVYRHDVQLGQLEAKFNQTVATFRSPPTNETDALTPALSFIADAGLIAPAFKHSDFEEEAEVRLQLYQYEADIAAPLEFRESAAGLTPYISIPLTSSSIQARDVIKEVGIGPQGNPGEAQRAVRQLLDRRELREARVWQSKVPLRW